MINGPGDPLSAPLLGGDAVVGTTLLLTVGVRGAAAERQPHQQGGDHSGKQVGHGVFACHPIVLGANRRSIPPVTGRWHRSTAAPAADWAASAHQPGSSIARPQRPRMARPMEPLPPAPSAQAASSLAPPMRSLPAYTWGVEATPREALNRSASSWLVSRWSEMYWLGKGRGGRLRIWGAGWHPGLKAVCSHDALSTARESQAPGSTLPTPAPPSEQSARPQNSQPGRSSSTRASSTITPPLMPLRMRPPRSVSLLLLRAHTANPTISASSAM